MAGLGVFPLNRPWRLLVSPSASGAWNMALDEALAESVRSGASPFLRFYTWAPYTLSLGRFQNPEAGLSAVARSVPRVRRSTGGGAIWHADELTYSLGCHQDDVGVRGVKASFEQLCGFLLDTWQELGWQAGFAKDGNVVDALGAPTPACFAGTEEYDILVGGRKLGGNAQRRDRSTIFQHGSIPIRLDHQELARLFLPGFRPSATAITDLDACGWGRSPDDLAALLAERFEARLKVVLHPTSPSDQELARAQTLVEQRYENSAWTEKGSGSVRDS